ncbi:hypothetical protein CEXT_401861 [Caerostris extrusa]|uniref:Uncharacterized protein n=1 Tax=Caerostris extrusa TaxID=172846 RepID=A0AAV4N4M3_CAEEX|nr:hypothetical protein CEXT_401861 [Caerostris extrusa]
MDSGIDTDSKPVRDFRVVNPVRLPGDEKFYSSAGQTSASSMVDLVELVEVAGAEKGTAIVCLRIFWHRGDKTHFLLFNVDEITRNLHVPVEGLIFLNISRTLSVSQKNPDFHLNRFQVV